MSRHRQRSSRSQFPVSQPADRQPEIALQEQESLENIQTLLARGKTEEALRQLDTAPNWIQRTPSYALVRASALMQYGDIDASGEILRELERKKPRFIPLYIPLATWYLMQEWPAHAMRAARKVLDSAGLDAEARGVAQNLAGGAKEMIESFADHQGLAFEPAEQATWHNEQAQLAMMDGSLVEVERQARQALGIAPQWNAPRNNLAQALYWKGKCREAIAECETVLANDPSNVHGLKNLATFHAGLGETEQGRKYANRLSVLSKDAERESLTADIALTTLAILEDSDRLWDLAQRYLRRREGVLLSQSWHCLGVAATRLGHYKEAKKFLERAMSGNDTPFIADAIKDVTAASKAGEAKLTWPPVYPGIELFLPEHLMAEWAEIAEKVPDNHPTPAQQRRIESFFARYPFVLQGFKRILWTEKACLAGASALVMANRPEADAEILRFALSDCGENDSRMKAIMMLIDAGRYTPEEPVKFWDAEEDEWHDVWLFSQQIEEVEYNVNPRTADLVTRSRQAENPQDAIALLRRAVENDPTCAIALHNLGTLLLQQGQKEEGERLMLQAVEVDPTYSFGFANLAFLEAQRDNEEAALDYLMQVNKAKVITPDTSVIANLAYMLIAARNNDIEKARYHFDLAKRIDPDHPLLENFEEWLDRIETFSEGFGFLADYQKQSANRFHRKMLNSPLKAEMDLEACLSGMTNDSLAAICRFWKSQGYGKKQAMVARLTARILDVDIFGEVVRDLDKKELEALRWILDGGGWRPWEEFTGKFGDDMDESPYWRYHDPESIPGRLKMAGLLFAGTLDGRHTAFIPADVRAVLSKALNSSPA